MSATIAVLIALATPACAQAPSSAEVQIDRGLDICERFVTRRLDDSIQYYGDQAGFRPTGRLRIQRWSEAADPAAWVELEADGASMTCSVRASAPVLGPPEAMIRMLDERYLARGYRRAEGDTGAFAAAWIHDEDGLATLTTTAEAQEITLTP